MKQIGSIRLMEMIEIAIQLEGSQKAFARKVGISQQYLTDILKGRRDIAAPPILNYLGLEKVISYRRIDGGQL